MGTKHTPGPWVVDPKRSLRVIAVGDETVASCGASDLIRGSWEANAALIAAAPELLEALEDYVKVHEFLGHADRPHYQAAIKAIAKAKGETK